MNDREQLKRLANVLDTKFEGPLGVRFGWDAIVGLIPGIGDIVTSGLSFYILVTAARFGVDSATLMRMGINIIIDNVFDMIPVVGNLFDFYWKSNDRNIRLIEKHLSNPAQETIKSRMVLTLLAIILLSCLAVSLYGAVWIIKSIYHFIAT